MSDIVIPGICAFITSSDASYAAARAGSSLSAAPSDTPRVGQRLSGGVYTCYEMLVSFDTSFLDGINIESAVLRGMVGQTHDATPVDFTVEARLRDWGSTPDTGDFVAGASLGADPLLATLDTSIIRNPYLEFNEFTDVDLIANLDTAGITRIMLSSDHMRLNTAPAGDEYEEFFVYLTDTIELVITTPDLATLTIPRSTPTGWVESADAVYATAGVGSNIIKYNGSLDYNRVGQALFSGFYYISETMLAFDTSDLEGAEVLAAYLEMALYFDLSTTDFIIQARLHDWGDTMEAADWVPAASLGAKTLLATQSTGPSFSAFSYQRFVDVDLAANLNLGGITKMLLCSDREVAGTVPVGDENVGVWAKNVGALPRMVVILRRPTNDDFDAATDLGTRSERDVSASAGASAEVLELGATEPPGFLNDTRTLFPQMMRESGFAMVDDVLFIVGGWGNEGDPPTLPETATPIPIPHDDDSGGGEMGAVIAIDSNTGIATKITDLPELDGSTWVYEGAVQVLGAYCVASAGAVVIDGVMYVAGGYSNYYGTNPAVLDRYPTLAGSDANHSNSGEQIASYPQVALAIDLTTGVVTRITDKPCGTEYCSAVAIDGKAYFVGGYTNADNPYPYIDIYDPDTDTWSRSSISSAAIAAPYLSVHAGKIYVLDGDSYTFDTPPDIGSDPTAWESAATTYNEGGVIIYDPDTDTWSTGSANPNYWGWWGSRTSVERDGKLLVMGAYGPTDINNRNIHGYDPVADSWSVLGEIIDRRRSDAGGGARSDGLLYLFGGVASNTPETPSVEKSHGAASETLWWKWTPGAGIGALVTCSGEGVLGVGVWVGSDVTDLTLIASDSGNPASAAFDTADSVTYYFQVKSTGGLVTLQVSAPPANGWPAVLGPFNALPI